MPPPPPDYGGKGGGKGMPPPTGARLAPPPPAPEQPTWEYQQATGRLFLGFLDFLRVLNWLTELFKVAFNKDGAGEYYPWACFTLATSSFLVVQRWYDQVYVLLRALSVGKDPKKYFNICASRPGFACLCLPLTFVCAPITTLVMWMYQSKLQHFHEEASEKTDMTVFTQRPLGTVMLGMPLYSVASHLMMSQELVHHPIQIHIRTTQNLLQTLLEDIPCLIIDAIILFDGKRQEDAFWFAVSFGYSIFHTLVICTITAQEVHHHEHMTTTVSQPTTVGKSTPAITYA